MYKSSRYSLYIKSIFIALFIYLILCLIIKYKVSILTDLLISTVPDEYTGLLVNNLLFNLLKLVLAIQWIFIGITLYKLLKNKNYKKLLLIISLFFIIDVILIIFWERFFRFLWYYIRAEKRADIQNIRLYSNSLPLFF